MALHICGMGSPIPMRSTSPRPASAPPRHAVNRNFREELPRVQHQDNLHLALIVPVSGVRPQTAPGPLRGPSSAPRYRHDHSLQRARSSLIRAAFPTTYSCPHPGGTPVQRPAGQPHGTGNVRASAFSPIPPVKTTASGPAPEWCNTSQCRKPSAGQRPQRVSLPIILSRRQ